jgi:two-component system, NarL family, sensor histidine kinase UhpB
VSVSAGDVGAGKRSHRGLGALLSERPIVEKILIANSAIILVGAVFGTYITRRFADQSSLALTAIFFACGVGITVLANYLVLRAALRPLVELSRAMESLHKGEPQEVHMDSSDPNLRRVSRSFNDMCQRLEEESKLYSAKLLSSIEEERRRIGRELHDDTSQTLAAVMINLELVEKSLAEVSPAIRERVANSKDLLRYTLEQIKLLVYDLRNPTRREAAPASSSMSMPWRFGFPEMSRRLCSGSPRRPSRTPSSTPAGPRSWSGSRPRRASCTSP